MRLTRCRPASPANFAWLLRRNIPGYCSAGTYIWLRLGAPVGNRTAPPPVIRGKSNARSKTHAETQRQPLQSYGENVDRVRAAPRAVGTSWLIILLLIMAVAAPRLFGAAPSAAAEMAHAARSE